MLIGGVPLIPLAFLHGILRGLVGIPNYNLDSSIKDENK